MIYVPFVFFLLLAIIIIKQRGLDASAYISLLYAISAFFSILYYNDGATALYKDACTFFPTVIYCGLISLAILPVYKFNTANLQRITMPNTVAIKGLTYLYFTIFVVLLFAYLDDLIFIFTFDDFAELRDDISDGETFITQYGGLLGFILLIFNILATISFVMIPVFFMMVLSKQKWWLQIMAILGSLPIVIIGMLGIDRSKSFYWVIILGLSLVIFWRHLGQKTKKIVTVLVSLLLLGVLSYFGSVTSDRFEDTDSGVEGGVVSYAGQTYVNFCYFFENFNNGETFSTRYMFPAIHFWILQDYEGAVALQQDLDKHTGIITGVFYSFLGSFIVDNNQIGPFVYMVFYLVLFFICLRCKRNSEISLLNFFYFYCLSIVPTCGFILYIYTSPYMTISIMLIILLIALTYLQKR